MRIKVLNYILICLPAFIMHSCMFHKHTVGEGPIGNKNTSKVYDKMKLSYLFWGVFPLQEERLSLPEDKNYQIRSSFHIEDALLSLVTGGIFSMRTIKILVFKKERIKGCDYKINDKVTVTLNKEVLFGKIVGMDAKTRKVSFVYQNIYGEKLVKSLPFKRLIQISESEYMQRTREWQTEIEKYKFKVGEYVEWPMNDNMEFGEIIKLNNRTHKATIELTTIFDDIIKMQVPYLELKSISSQDFDSRMEDWNLVKEDYKFFVGERAKWRISEHKLLSVKISSLNNSNHKAKIVYRDVDGSEKSKSVSVLELIKMN